MSWVTVIWSMTASACLTLALMHLLIWCRQRDSWANLMFALAAVATAAFAACEFWIMRAQTPAEFGRAMWWANLPGGVLVATMVIFVRLYLRAGRLWLVWSVCGIRAVALLINFFSEPNINYREITAVHQIPFLGEPVSVVTAVVNPLMILPHVSLVLMMIYIVDATIAVWRRGDHRQALIVGGGLMFFILGGVCQIMLALWQVVHMPVITSLFFAGVVAAMGYELSQDALRAAQLSRELRESEHRFSLAADAAKLGIWIRDLVKNEIWATSNWRALFGFSPSQRLEFADVLNRIHPDDREVFNHNFKKAMAGGGHYETDYRIVLPENRTRWIASRGKIEFDPQGKPVMLRGVSVDITARKQAELEVQSQRDELAHLTRVSTLGELATSMAHELNQPLGAILSNAEAAEMILKQDPPPLDEIQAILTDIRKDDERAGEVIRRMRTLIKKNALERQPVELSSVVTEALRLLSAKAAGNSTVIVNELSAQLPSVSGDRIQLQQVLLNLILNAMDALTERPAKKRRVVIHASHDGNGTVELSVRDTGPGIDPARLPRLFEPFFTTKQSGIGMGLPICRRIVEAHHGRVWAENHPDGGAIFRVTLPVVPGNQ